MTFRDLPDVARPLLDFHEATAAQFGIDVEFLRGVLEDPRSATIDETLAVLLVAAAPDYLARSGARLHSIGYSGLKDLL